MTLIKGNTIYVDDIVTKGVIRDIRAYNGDLAAAVSDIGSQEVTLLISQPVTLNQDLTIPENIRLKFLKGCPITVGTKSETTETIGTGDGSTTSFNYTVTDPPIARNSVTVTYTINGTEYTANDNGAGTISGTNLSGKVDYQNGNISLTFSTAPDDGADITITYKPAYSLTINGAIETGLWQIFDGDGVVDISKTTRSIVTIENIRELVAKTKDQTGFGCDVNVLGYHEVGDGGGGIFYWDANEDRSNHNGGTIIDPLVQFPEDWADTTQRETWFTALGSGTGCWKRVYNDTVIVDWFGCDSTGIIECSDILNLIFSKFHNIEFKPRGQYRIQSTVNLGSNEETGRHIVDGKQALIVVDGPITGVKIASPSSSTFIGVFKNFRFKSENSAKIALYIDAINAYSTVENVWVFNGFTEYGIKIVNNISFNVTNIRCDSPVYIQRDEENSNRANNLNLFKNVEIKNTLTIIGASNVMFDGLIVEGTSNPGIIINNSPLLVFRGLWLESLTTSGIPVTITDSNVVIEDSWIDIDTQNQFEYFMKVDKSSVSIKNSFIRCTRLYKDFKLISSVLRIRDCSILNALWAELDEVSDVTYEGNVFASNSYTSENYHYAAIVETINVANTRYIGKEIQYAWRNMVGTTGNNLGGMTTDPVVDGYINGFPATKLVVDPNTTGKWQNWTHTVASDDVEEGDKLLWTMFIKSDTDVTIGLAVGNYENKAQYVFIPKNRVVKVVYLSTVDVIETQNMYYWIINDSDSEATVSIAGLTCMKVNNLKDMTMLDAVALPNRSDNKRVIRNCTLQGSSLIYHVSSETDIEGDVQQGDIIIYPSLLLQ